MCGGTWSPARAALADGGGGRLPVLLLVDVALEATRLPDSVHGHVDHEPVRGGARPVAGESHGRAMSPNSLRLDPLPSPGCCLRQLAQTLLNPDPAFSTTHERRTVALRSRQHLPDDSPE